jgi:hypothetical protein
LASSLRVTEIMFNPPGADEEYEWLEVANINPMLPLNLAGVEFTEGIRFTFPDVTLAPGERAVIVRSLDGFASGYESDARVLGTYDRALSNDGDHLIVTATRNGLRSTLLDFFFGDD